MSIRAQDEVKCEDARLHRLALVPLFFSIPPVCVCGNFTPHLFLILILQPQPLLDAVASLQEDFPLGALGENPHKHPRQVDAGEQHRVGHQLHTNKNRHAKQIWQHPHTVCAHESEHTCPYVCFWVQSYILTGLDFTILD